MFFIYHDIDSSSGECSTYILWNLSNICKLTMYKTVLMYINNVHKPKGNDFCLMHISLYSYDDKGRQNFVYRFDCSSQDME